MKKLAIALLALVMVLTTVLVPILADENTDTVVGYSAARIRKADLTVVANINEYDAENVLPAYKITDAAGLVKLSQIVNGVAATDTTPAVEPNDLEGVYIYLAKDINMEGVAFTPIGNQLFEGGVGMKEYAFKGTFNGHGHVIENLVVTSDVSLGDQQYAGLFGLLDSATVKNLVLAANCSFEQTGTSGISGLGYIAGKAKGKTTIDNIYNAATASTSASHAAMVGRGQVNSLTNSTNAGAITSTGSSTAGFMGYNEGTTLVENCRNIGAITGGNAAGIVSRGRGVVVIKNCINNGEITNENEGGVAMAIGAYLDQAANKLTIENCINYGKVTGGEGTTGIYFVKADVVLTTPVVDTNNVDNYNESAPVTDPTYVEYVVTPNYDAEDGAGDGETAFVTTTPPPTAQEPGVLEAPDANAIGYSSAKVVEVDTTKVVNILNYSEELGTDLEDEYKITNVAGFKKLDELLYTYVTFSGVTIYLANDIDFDTASGFKPISYDLQSIKHVNGTAMFYFAGTLDGQGECISNLKMVSKEDGKVYDEDKNEIALGEGEQNVSLVALFGFTKGAEFKNLVIDETCSFTFSGPSSAQNPITASLVGKTGGGLIVNNVWTQADLSGGRFAGAIVGRCGGQYEIKNFTNTGDITATQCAGGLVGFDQGGGLIENSRNAGNVSRPGNFGNASYCSAGFVARATKTTTLKNCINNGIISGADNAGVFFGTIHSAITLTDCTNYGASIATANPEAVGLEHAAKMGTDIKDPAGNVIGKDYSACIVNSTNVVDKAGEVDESLKFENIVKDYNAEQDDPNGVGSGNNGGTEAPTGDGNNGGTEAPTGDGATNAPTGDANNGSTTAPAGGTNAPATDGGVADGEGDGSDDVEEEGGCSSTVIGGAAVIVLISGAAITLFKKKKD